MPRLVPPTFGRQPRVIAYSWYAVTLTTHVFLRENRDEIVREWEALVAQEPRAVELTGAILRNHIPQLVDELADWMGGSAPPGSQRLTAAAIVHAAQRLDRAFHLTQLIHEVRLLRVTIIRLLLAAEAREQGRVGAEGMERRVEELARLNAGLDFAITDAVEYFVAERERRLVALANHEATLARESDQRKSDFLAVLSHELRNPLAPIRNGLRILEQVDARSEQAQRAREVIGRQAKHLTRLVDDLLDMTRISRGKIELHRERFDLRDSVRSTCDDMRSTFEQRGLDLRLEIPAGPVWIDGDPTRIAQVLSNLLQNACRFARSAVNVHVAIAPDEARAALEVRDDGAGMGPGVVEHVFEPFVQGPQGPARKEGGLGLGLALVKGLVDLHGGWVAARSGGPGLGSEFVVELPLAPAPQRVAPTAEHGRRAAAPRVVLIIEDNADAGETLAQILELAGHRTYIARDGRSGIALALEVTPDVVLCDIGLPDVDGSAVARALRANGDLPGTRLVALSGYAQPEDKRRATDAGFDAHLSKPPPLDALSEILAGP
jgi:signal transduction histidine kinase